MELPYIIRKKCANVNKSEKRVLEFLLKHEDAFEQNYFVNTFPKEIRPQILKSIRKLQRLGFIYENYTSEGIVIQLEKNKKDDALRIVNPIYIHDPSEDPIEELIPKSFKIFKIIEAEHKQNGGLGKYVLCYKKKDKHYIKCFIRNTRGQLKGIILGSIYDPNSTISKWVKEFDRIFPQSLFTKEDVKNKFPVALRGNNQPTKAVIEYLCLTKFLIRFDYVDDPSKFQRTGKKLPITTLEEILLLHEIKPKRMAINGIKYAYTEEDGLYPVLI